ncbi:MAG: DUF192 domain-containing protein [Proteobacteria bacterium]|nr:DUF192 domain-containing protein [Pseudomonadota bacterium]MDA1062861.1 DUF192 domain-containing protein [Pseudomonadota bacterium]
MRGLALLLVLLAGNALAADDELDARFDKGMLIVHASEFACHRFDMHIAESDEQRARGLMFVRSLPDTAGMLFIYEIDMYLSIWMKNTFIPLDILFIRSDGTVSSITYDAEPQSLKSMVALEPVRYVLELNAGVAESLSIDQYSRIEWVRNDADE